MLGKGTPCPAPAPTFIFSPNPGMTCEGKESARTAALRCPRDQSGLQGDCRAEVVEGGQQPRGHGRAQANNGPAQSMDLRTRSPRTQCPRSNVLLLIGHTAAGRISSGGTVPKGLRAPPGAPFNNSTALGVPRPPTPHHPILDPPV